MDVGLPFIIFSIVTDCGNFNFPEVNIVSICRLGITEYYVSTKDRLSWRGL